MLGELMAALAHMWIPCHTEMILTEMKKLLLNQRGGCTEEKDPRGKKPEKTKMCRMRTY
jgi:hypothetical protein